MTQMLTLYNRVANGLDRLAPHLLPLIARLAFAAVLLFYFWASATTKLGPGLFGFLMPSDGAYIQFFPKNAHSTQTGTQTPCFGQSLQKCRAAYETKRGEYRR